MNHRQFVLLLVYLGALSCANLGSAVELGQSSTRLLSWNDGIISTTLPLGTTYAAGIDTTSLTTVSTQSASLGSFNIVLNATPALLSNAPAMAAFERAAARWEAVISDPITVTIVADLSNDGFSASNIIGQAQSVPLFDEFDDEILISWKAEAALDADDAIVAAIPGTAAFNTNLPSGFVRDSRMSATKANLKAMNVPFDLDAIFGATDAMIKFNSDFAFDYDNSDGVSIFQVDFESAALHEIGHALGFISAVDGVDASMPNVGADLIVSAKPLDMFRFARSGDDDPSSIADFSTFVREWTPGVNSAWDQINPIADVPAELRFSTGVANGDGRQASHWLDNNLTGNYIGALDPTLNHGHAFEITNADLRALDLIGWDIQVVPEPGSFTLALLAGCAGLFLTWRRRK